MLSDVYVLIPLMCGLFFLPSFYAFICYLQSINCPFFMIPIIYLSVPNSSCCPSLILFFRRVHQLSPFDEEHDHKSYLSVQLYKVTKTRATSTCCKQ